MASADLDLRIKAALITLTIFGLAVGVAFFAIFATESVVLWTIGGAAVLTVGHFAYQGVLEDLRRDEIRKARSIERRRVTLDLERDKQVDS